MDFPGNSNTEKTEQVVKPEVVKVVSTAGVIRKKSLGKRFKGVIFDGALKGAVNYVTRDVLLPALKNMMFDTLTKGSERVIFGDTPRRRSVGNEPNRPRVSYNNPVNRGYSNSRAMLPDQPPHVARRQEGSEVVLVSKTDAEKVLHTMIEILDRYGMVTLADFNELCDLASAHTDYKWGWTNLLYVGVLQRRDGFIIDLPPLEAL